MTFKKYSYLTVLPFFLFLPAHLAAQTPAAQPPPDTLILNDGEKLIGHLVRAVGSSLVFKSDLLGEINVDWSKVKELHAAGPYAVVEKGVKLGRHPDTSDIPRGSLQVTGQNLEVHPEADAPVRSIPLANAENVIALPTFDKDVAHNPGFLEGWNGTITAGASVVQATQQSRAFNGQVNLVRTVPAESWLEPHNRTEFDFSASDGFVEQPNTPRVKTDILHADVQRDEYFTGSRVYGFGQAIFDHNYSQGLDLQQNYGGGIGWTTIDRANLTLDVKGSVSYVHQSFQSDDQEHSLVASDFSQSLRRKLPRGMLFLEQVSVTPSWNIRRAWVAAGSASFAAPVYKRLSFTVGVQDNFLNDPPAGFRKNSFQAITGLSYSLR